MNDIAARRWPACPTVPSRARPQLLRSRASRFPAGASEFFILRQSGEQPVPGSAPRFFLPQEKVRDTSSQ